MCCWERGAKAAAAACRLLLQVAPAALSTPAWLLPFEAGVWLWS